MPGFTVRARCMQDPCVMLIHVIIRLKPSNSLRRCRAYPPWSCLGTNVGWASPSPWSTLPITLLASSKAFASHCSWKICAAGMLSLWPGTTVLKPKCDAVALCHNTLSKKLPASTQNSWHIVPINFHRLVSNKFPSCSFKEISIMWFPRNCYRLVY